MSLADGDIVIVGIGCTAFGEHFDRGYSDLAYEAVQGALSDAGGLDAARIDAAWLGTAFPDAGVYKGRSGMDLAEAIGRFDLPVTRVSNYCATGAEAMRGAANSLLAGECDMALALGVEKLRDRSPTESLVRMMATGGHPLVQKGFTAAGTFAVYASRRMHEYGLTPEQLAQVSVKNHANAAKNPLAHHRAPVTLEQVMQSPMVADPLTLLQACPTTDGAAAAILMRRADAEKLPGVRPVLLAGLGLSVATGWDLPFFDPYHDFLSFQSTRTAAATAYAQAGVKDPRTDVDLVEVHDCFTITEILTYEDLGLCDQGQGGAFVEGGGASAGGETPVNLSGGLLSCGHPIGATGIRMCWEIVQHLRGDAGDRQQQGATCGVAHNIGGPGAVAAVTVLRSL